MSMGKKSEPMKALVAVSSNGYFNLIVKHWPQETAPNSPWGCEFEAVGSQYPDDLGMRPPKEAGLWVWEGYVYYPGPNVEGVCDDGPEWQGTWRRATDEDMMEVLV